MPVIFFLDFYLLFYHKSVLLRTGATKDPKGRIIAPAIIIDVATTIALASAEVAPKKEIFWTDGSSRWRVALLTSGRVINKICSKHN
jgi:hypothetical protein